MCIYICVYIYIYTHVYLHTRTKAKALVMFSFFQRFYFLNPGVNKSRPYRPQGIFPPLRTIMSDK